MQLPEKLKSRRFFERDQEFSNDLKKLIDAYEKSADEAAWYAKRAIKHGKLEYLRQAQWYEAVTCTIEEVLSLHIQADGDDWPFDIPEPPEFSRI